MNATVVGLVTPHLLRVIDLADQAQKGMNVDWHVRDAVTKTVDDLTEQFNGPTLLAAYVEGLENAARQAPPARAAYVGVLQAAVAAARSRMRV